MRYLSWTKKYLILLILSVNVCYAENILLQAPQKIPEEAINKTIVQAASIEMKWTICVGSGSCVHFPIKSGANCDSNFQLILTGNKFVNELTKEEINLFKKGDDTLIYSYGNLGNNACRGQAEKEEFSMFAQSLVISQATPTKASISKVAELINNKNVVFYTGAGVSSPVVPDMAKLMLQLKLPRNTSSDVDTSQYAIEFLRRTLAEPDEVIKIIDNFKKACLYGNPTMAHYAVKDIVLLKDWQLVTENLDLLHQRSGIQPLGRIDTADKINFSWLKKNIKGKHFRRVDFIIAAGLNSDEVGLLALYKKHNPKGKIIAMNLVQPNYLGDDDILVVGDLQETLPDLFENLSRLSTTNKNKNEIFTDELSVVSNIQG